MCGVRGTQLRNTIDSPTLPVGRPRSLSLILDSLSHSLYILSHADHLL